MDGPYRKKTKKQKYWKWNFRVHILKHIEWDQSRNLNDIWSRVHTFLDTKQTFLKLKQGTLQKWMEHSKSTMRGREDSKPIISSLRPNIFFSKFMKRLSYVYQSWKIWYLSCPCKNLAFKNKVLGNSKIFFDHSLKIFWCELLSYFMARVHTKSLG